MIDLASILTVPTLRDDLGRVETALRAAVEAGDPFLSEAAGHLVRAGGKRLRPALTLAAAYTSTAPAADASVQGGVAVELVHVGSLYHDDVIDEATSRRGVESVNARWGNLVAILAGDFLLARASEIAASLGTEVAGLLAATIGRLCEGQVRELAHAFDVGRSEASYLDAIAGKTASLMAAACRIGGITAGLSRQCIDALTAYGRGIGMVFQIVDDVLDVVASDEELGKPAGNDLVEGVYTLPVIIALADRQTGEELRRVLGAPIDRPQSERVRKIVRSNGAVAGAMTVARRYAVEATTAIRSVGDGPVVEALADVGHHLIDTVPPPP